MELNGVGLVPAREVTRTTVAFWPCRRAATRRESNARVVSKVPQKLTSKMLRAAVASIAGNGIVCHNYRILISLSSSPRAVISVRTYPSIIEDILSIPPVLEVISKQQSLIESLDVTSKASCSISLGTPAIFVRVLCGCKDPISCLVEFNGESRTEAATRSSSDYNCLLLLRHL